MAAGPKSEQVDFFQRLTGNLRKSGVVILSTGAEKNKNQACSDLSPSALVLRFTCQNYRSWFAKTAWENRRFVFVTGPGLTGRGDCEKKRARRIRREGLNFPAPGITIGLDVFCHRCGRAVGEQPRGMLSPRVHDYACVRGVITILFFQRTKTISAAF